MLIDPLELMTGIALFSDSVIFSKKLRFIFELYDFNENEELEIFDLQFMFC